MFTEVRVQVTVVQEPGQMFQWYKYKGICYTGTGTEVHVTVYKYKAPCYSGTSTEVHVTVAQLHMYMLHLVLETCGCSYEMIK